jgi:hypothetical protein
MNEPTLHIDKDGRWFFQGEEITHRKTYLLFCQNLTRDPSGRIILKIGDEQCPVEVEDTPFVVVSLMFHSSAAGGLESIDLVLNDGSQEPLDPSSLRIRPDHVPCCRVRKGLFEARFSRQAYQLLIPHIQQDPDDSSFFLPLGGKKYRLA